MGLSKLAYISEAKKPIVATNYYISDYCRVLFEYTAENDDELTLVKGEVIILVSKTSSDEGWWEGEKTLNDGRYGNIKFI